ncbi:MAG: hypothetical protein ACPLRW_07170 [Moorellales bacterium]
MADYGATLNRDQQLIKTTADFSAGYNRWINNVANLDDGGVILTTTPLGASASYTQTSIDRLIPNGANLPPYPIGRVRGLVWADQAGTLYLEESENDSTWTTITSMPVSAGVTTELPWTNLTKRYFRFRYVNGPTAQTSFVLIQQCAGLAVSNVQLAGSYDTMRPPVVGVKTVTATAAEIFAGASRLVGRRKMILKNEDPILRFRIGPSSVTQQNGFPIEPGAVIELSFDPAIDVPIYAISEGANLQVAVMEL